MFVPLGSAEFVGLAVAAVTFVAAVACGSLSLARLAVLAMAVKRTDVTEVAEAATATLACSWRWADFASRAPRSHDALPLWLPQPKLNVGFKLVGAATKRTVASVRSPPWVQAVTVHRAVCPRWMLVLAGCTATQRLTWLGSGVALVVDATGLLLTGGLLVVAVEVGVLDGVASGDALVVAVLVDADVDALADVVGLPVEDAVCAEGEGSVVGVGDFETLAVGVLVGGSLVDVCGLAVALAELLAVVVGVGVGLESGTTWHCCAVAPAAATVAVSSAG